MNKIKLISLILAALLCCSIFIGCREDAESTDGPVTTPVSPEELQELIDQGVIEDPNDTSEPAEPAPYTKGKVEGNVYTNEAADLTLRIPTGWSVSDDYELSSLMGITYDFENYDAYIAEVAKSTDIFDLVAKDSTEDFSIMILFQDMAQFSNMTAVEFLEMQKASLISETATFEKSDVTEVSYSGNTYAILKSVSTPDEGEKAVQLFYAKIVDGRMMTIMMTSPYDEPINPDTIFA